MISPVLHQIFSHCRTSTIILVFTPQIQFSYKIKRDDFTEVLLSLPSGPLKIACHKGAFDMLHIFNLTSRPSWEMQSLEVNQRFLCGLKVVCFYLCSCWTVSFTAEKDAKSYLLHQSKYSTKGGSLKIYFL